MDPPERLEEGACSKLYDGRAPGGQIGTRLQTGGERGCAVRVEDRAVRIRDEAGGEHVIEQVIPLPPLLLLLSRQLLDPEMRAGKFLEDRSIEVERFVEKLTQRDRRRHVLRHEPECASAQLRSMTEPAARGIAVGRHR